MKQSLKKWACLFFALVMVITMSGISGLSVHASDEDLSDEEYEEIENDGAGIEYSNVTFNIVGDGSVKVTTWTDESDITTEPGTSTTVTNGQVVTLKNGLFARITATAPEESFIHMSIKDEEGSLMEDETSVKAKSATHDLTMDANNLIITVTFSEVEVPAVEVSVEETTAKGTEDQPEKGDKFVGNMKITAMVGGNGHTVHSITVKATSGILKGKKFKVYCSDHGAAAPSVGDSYKYTWTVTKVNKSTGKVTGSVYAKIIGKQSATNASMQRPSGKGYQRVKATVSMTFVYNGKIQLQKVSAHPELTEGNSCYSLKGAKYGLYKDKDCKNLVKTLVTDEKGKTDEVEVTAGNYYLKEIEAPKGFVLDTTAYQVGINGSETTTVSVKDVPANDPFGIILSKIDQESGGFTNVGAASLAGAQFTITYYDGYYNSVKDLPEEHTRQWVIETKELKNADGRVAYFARLEEAYKVSGDEFFYTGENTTPSLPLGTITVKETKAPTGYLLEGSVFKNSNGDVIEGTYLTQIVEDKELNNGTIKGGNEFSISDKVIRGDLEFRKIDEETQEAMAGIPFKITSVTTGESHTVVTDFNGYYSSSSDYNMHSFNTNEGEEDSGLWFGIDANGDQVDIDDESGALPYDTYEIEELKCEANEGKRLYKDKVVIYRNNTVVNMGNLENPDVTLGTKAHDSSSGTHVSQADSSVTIVDTVNYTGVTKGKAYELITKVYHPETGSFLLDKDGKEITASKVFTPKTAEGEVEVEITFDASALANSSIVIYEYLYLDGELIAQHTDPNDEEQTISFPEIRTMAYDKDTLSHISNADEEISIVDEVYYSNLTVGKEYELVGTAYDKESQQPAKDDEGNTVTAKAKFTPETPDGVAEVEFTFKGLSLKGRTLVFVETLYKDGREYAVHFDLEDEEQTIYIPEIGTTLTEEESGLHIAEPSELITLVDTVAYKNLIPGKTYTLDGVLMDKASKEPVLDGENEVTAQTVFTPEAPDGEVALTFTFNASALAGRTVVAFETVTIEGKEVAVHADIEDENQSVHFPAIGTTATDAKDGDHKIEPDGKQTINDLVEYKNLIPGQKYKMVGTLMLKETHSPMLHENEEIIVEKIFVPEAEDGSVELSFSFMAEEQQGKEIVVFEQLYAIADGEEDGEDKEIFIAGHEDIEDEGQTVKVKEVKKSIKETVQTGDPFLTFILFTFALLAAGLYYIKRKMHI